MTTKEFITKAKIIHHNKYDYSKTIYINARTKIIFECPIHGQIKQNPNSHLNSCGCQYCASNKMTTKEFINKSNKIHNFLYSYNKTKYIDARSKVKIECKIHGEFIQKASAHIEGQGCPKCALLSPKRYKKDQNHFIGLSQQIHNNKYDYSKTIYKSSRKKVVIICPIHGEFTQRASAHIGGQGCPKCNDHNKISEKEFLNRANKIHNNKYDYSKINYKSLNHKITILCPIHGEFSQKASNHIINKNGCIKCGQELMQSKLIHTTEEFIEKAKKVHDDVYDYSKTKYKESKKKTIIVCEKHGEFNQRPNDHLSGRGCPQCAGTHLQTEIFDFVSKYIKAKFNDRQAIYPLELDIFIPTKQIGIEVNGLYWHSFDHKENNEEINKHSIKCDLCQKKGIHLLQINENEWRDKQKIVKSIIKLKLGLSNEIFAKKCKIVNLDNKQYKKFINLNHLQEYKSADVKNGLVLNDELVAVISFNKHNKYEWEMIKFINKSGINVIGGADKLFKYFLKNYNPNQVLAYADRRYSNGNLYKKLGFKLNSITKPNYVYVKRDIVYPQFMECKSIDMFNNGYRRLWDAGNFKFLWK